MIERPIWNEQLVAAWKQTSIVWLTGPRRVGKTVLARSLPDTEFLNCDLPSAAESQISRPTVTNWLEVYQITHVAHWVRPFSAGGRREIVAQPKVFGFDTGLVCYARGWDHLRTEDCGVMWEHLVLDALIAAGLPKIHFWRDKQQREVDFIVPRGRDAVDAIECKWKPEAFETRGLGAFREQYSRGNNYVVSPLNGPAYERVQDGFKVKFLSPGALRQALA